MEDQLIPMRDGQVKLCTDVYLPAVQGKVDDSLKFPTVFIRTPYNKKNADSRNSADFWPRHGFAWCDAPPSCVV